jgi:hypothetical protein
MPKNNQGKHFASKFAMSRYDRAHEGEPKSQEHEEMGEESPEDVVAEHGAAHEVTINHEDGKHEVHSKHPDGHEHHSAHASAKEAHDHAATLAGVGQDEDSMAGF